MYSSVNLQLPEQVPKGTGQISCTFMMSVEGSGSGLGVAHRCSTPGKDLYGGVVYLDSQKVTDPRGQVLMRILTYSHTERSLLTLAEPLVPSESKECVKEFCHHVKNVCGRGYNGEGQLELIEGFEANFWKISADASGGVRLGWEESFPERGDGRNKFVECEFHFLESERKFEAKLGDDDLVAEHKKVVRKFLVSKDGTGREEAKGNMKVKTMYLLHTFNVGLDAVRSRFCVLCIGWRAHFVVVDKK